MKRRGYNEEYEAKKKLIDRFGVLGVVKVAIAQFGADFICFEKGKVALAVEVKACHGKKYYPNEREKKQFERIIEFCFEHQCRGELWIKYPYLDFEVQALTHGI